MCVEKGSSVHVIRSELAGLATLEAFAIEKICSALANELSSSVLADLATLEALAVDLRGSGLLREVRRLGLAKAVLRPVQRN